jgi:hypothetical protein
VTARAWLGPLWLAAVVLAIYLPDLGLGFLKDDFAWIRSSRLARPADALHLVTAPASGFFRPVVALSFGLNAQAFGLRAFGYGLTNLALLAACAAGVWRLAAALGLAYPGRLVATAIFCLNFHGINLALLWISGRTALLLGAASVWAAVASLRGRPILAGGLALVALLSKEEAVALPIVFAAWAAIRAEGETRARLRAAVAASWPSLVALAVYTVLRSRTGAMTFATAPAFYQPRFDLAGVAGNVLEYLDRSSTLAAAVVVATCLMARRLPRLDAADRGRLAVAAVWTIALFAITVWLPVRSSLYVVTPAIGAAVAAATLIAGVWQMAPARSARLAAIVGLVLPLLLWPLYHARNQRLASEARLSAEVMAILSRHAFAARPLTGVVLIDDPQARPSLYHALGPHFPDAAALAFGRPIPVSLDNTPEASPQLVPAGPATLRFALSAGRLIALH